MIHYVIALYDLKAAAYAPPAFFPAKGIAVRAFGDAVLAKQGNLGKHPEDFLLQELGTFNDNNGEFVNQSPPITLATGAEYAKAQVVNEYPQGGPLNEPPSA